MAWIGARARAARRERKSAERRILATYTRLTWHQRHRVLCVSALTFFCFFYGIFWVLLGPSMLPMLLIPLGLLLSLVIWALPETGRAPERLLRVGLFAYLFGLLCWPDYIAIALPGLPWITVIRLIGFPLAFLLLIAVSVSEEFRERAKAILAPSPLIWKAVTAFAIIGLLSIALSKDPGASLSKFSIAQINWTAIFFVSCFVFVQPGAIRLFAGSLWAIVLFVSAIGLDEARLQRVPWAGHIPSFLVIQDESVQRILAGTARAGTSIYRVQSKFGTSLGLAEYLALATPFVLHFIFTGRSMAVRLAAAMTIPLIFYTVHLTDSRLAAIGLFVSLALYLLYWGVMQWRRNPDSLFGPAITLGYPAIFAVLLASTVLVGRIRAQFWGDGSQQASTDARKTMYREGIPMVLRNPIGHGFGQGGQTLGYVNPAGVLTIDTYYLAVALEFGVVGFLVFYGMFLIAIWKSARTAFFGRVEESEWLGPLAIALLNFVIGKSVFSNLENHPLVFMMLGVVVALVYRETRLSAAVPVARAAREQTRRGSGVVPSFAKLPLPSRRPASAR